MMRPISLHEELAWKLLLKVYVISSYYSNRGSCYAINCMHIPIISCADSGYM